eukprot:COSAG05_NODE_209_length_14039_cov_138.574892_13_plen_119_part_00
MLRQAASWAPTMLRALVLAASLFAHNASSEAVAPQQQGGVVAPPREDGATGPSSPRQAFFIFFEAMLRGPDWPQNFELYRNGAFIMDPANVSAETVKAVKLALNVTVLLCRPSPAHCR